MVYYVTIQYKDYAYCKSLAAAKRAAREAGPGSTIEAFSGTKHSSGGSTRYILHFNGKSFKRPSYDDMRGYFYANPNLWSKK